jgi:hypothetical protein
MLKQYLLGQVAATGKSFYADFMKNERNMYYLDFLGGALKADLDLALSTSWSNVAIVTTSCASHNCNVPNRWNPWDSSTKWIISDKTVTLSNPFVQYRDGQGTEYMFDHLNAKNGTWINDNFEVEYAGYDDNTVVNVDFIGIKSANTDFAADFNGLVGLKPKKYNFLDSLKNKGHIDEKIVAIYTDPNEVTSSVKFGGFDPEAILEGSTTKTVKTHSADSWDLQFKSLSLNVLNFPPTLETNPMVLLEPMAPLNWLP